MEPFSINQSMPLALSVPSMRCFTQESRSVMQNSNLEDIEKL